MSFVPEEPRAVLLRLFRLELVQWIGTEPRMALRVMQLVEDALRSPFEGIGKPEPLRHHLRGQWSRRITREHRITYVVKSEGTFFLRARDHYTR